MNEIGLLYAFYEFSAYSVILPFIILLLKYRSLNRIHKLFLLLISLGVVNEIASFFMIYFLKTNLILFNTYALLESILILRLYMEWKVLKPGTMYLSLMMGLIVFWIMDNLIVHSIHQANGAFQSVYSILIVFLSIQMLNKQAVLHKQSFKDFSFLVNAAFLLYYSCKACTEVFYLLPFKFNDDFYNGLVIILSLFNLLLNGIFVIAALCIPPKNKYILLSQ